MDAELGSLNIIFTEFYYWVTVVFMFLIHAGLATYEVGATRRKNMLHTLMKGLLALPLVTITFFFFGWWIYFAFSNGPGISGGLIPAPWAVPWSELMGPHMGGPPASETLTPEDTAAWARLNGVFWAAFLLFSWTAAVILSGSVIERIRPAAYAMCAVLIGSVTWIIDASWGWNPSGWMVQLMGYHDAYASGVIHAIAGGSALALIIVVGPRIGRFGPNGEVREIKPHNQWLTTLGLFLVYTGFWGFYAACNVPIFDIGGESGSYFSATNIYFMPTTLSAITFNFLMSFAGGLLAAYIISRGDPIWTYSGGLIGIIGTSAGNDLYHPIQSLLIAVVVVFAVYKLHYWVERKFKIDDALGVVAVHGYSGFLGVVIAGFMLWGYPAAEPIEAGAAWFGTTPDGWPAINPLGNFFGAIIMFFVLGFVPMYILARILKAFGILRVPREVELAGLDKHYYGDAYPYHDATETEFEEIERTYAKD
jgi:ammonium transporter, Amt family